MRHLNLTLETPAENLALDEALLDAAEAGELDAGLLRLWELPDYCVILGRSSSTEKEVNLAECRKAGVPVLRRSSGGGTILAGPGCLMYSLVLDFKTHPELNKVDEAHRFVLKRLAALLAPDHEEILPIGTSDLAIRRTETEPWKKFSGNSLRLKRRHLLYHGTLLYNFDLPCISSWLTSATRTPEYRQSRHHDEFVTNLSAKRDVIVEKLIAGWQAETLISDWPQVRTADLVNSKYSNNPMWVIYNPTD